jgi:hypothetical protein
LTSWTAAGLYLLLTVAMTWPLVLGLGRDVPWDLGDSLLNMWILAWDAEQLKAIFGGDLSRIRTCFNANIFHPAPLTLAYSEHLFAQAVQIFPVYLATENPILCYNLLFLSTFVLCGLGTFLLVRELTGPSTSLGASSTAAAFLAGLLCAFAPYRFAQASHLQVLSVQWMPFVLYGFRRYFDTGRRRALAGGGAALVAQNLSSGYYLLYFAPLAGLYILWEIATRRLWRDRRTWTDLSAAAAGVVVCTLPFLLPYQQVRDELDLSRDPAEIVRFSADVNSYFTAFASNRAWGDTIRAFPKPEGELFPGVVPLLLAIVAAAALIGNVGLRDRRDMLPRDTKTGRLSTPTSHKPTPKEMAANTRHPSAVASSFSRKVSAAILATIALAHVGLALLAIFTRRVNFDVLLFEIRASNITRLLVIALVSGAAAVGLLPRARARLVEALRQPEAIFLALALLAWWLSLGPSPRVYGRPVDLWAPYGVLLEHVPGYDGLRVPARFAMIVALSCAVLGGLAVARIPRRAWIATGVLGLLFLAESHALPLRINGVWPLADFATPEPRVYRPARAPAIYRDLANEPAEAVVLEMPLGEPDYDLRAVYYSTVHWKKLVNGYSGYFPPHYNRLFAMLQASARDDDIAWFALETLGVTHVIVHEGAYLDDEGARFSAWLGRQGAAEVSRRGRDVMFELPH